MITHQLSTLPIGTFADLQETIAAGISPVAHMTVSNSTPGIVLRLSQSLLDDPSLTPESLRSLLDEFDLQVVGISGVGIADGIKAEIHRPDWQTEERLAYVFRASTLLAAILPEHITDAGISTNALTYRGWLDRDMPGNWTALTLNVIRAVQHLHAIKEQNGKTIHLDLELEPGALIRDANEAVTFFRDWLYGRGAAMLSDRAHLDTASAAEVIADHVRIALDTCHMQVVGDDMTTVLEAFSAANVRIGRLQVSPAVTCTIPEDDAAREAIRARLTELSSPRLLQQVVASKDDDVVQRWDDLPDAISAIDESVGHTWVIHHHAPMIDVRGSGVRPLVQETLQAVRAVAKRSTDVGVIEVRTANWGQFSEHVTPHAGISADLLRIGMALKGT